MVQQISRRESETWSAQSTQDEAIRSSAIAFLEDQRLAERSSADGQQVGVQAILARADDAAVALDLSMFLNAMTMSGSIDDEPALANDPARDAWRAIAVAAEEKLGFPLEPELFSNMLFVAHLGRETQPSVRALCRVLLSTFRDKHEGGLYHFFASLKFACDVDCTAVAARARLVSGDIDPSTREGAEALRTITSAILRSAAVCDVPADQNFTHGKSNGRLVKNVLKVYLDDHLVQPPESDRGLKINPVVVSNALGPVLLELKLGLRSLDEVIELREHTEGVALPRRAQATVREIVLANIAYVNAFLLDGHWRDGCRYYPSPDAFLCSYSENLRDFPELFGAVGAIDAMRQAIRDRRAAHADDCALDPTVSLNAAFRAIAATNVNMDPRRELDLLSERQDETGAWTDPDCLYSFGGNAKIPIHFRSPLLTTAIAIRAFAPATSNAMGSGAFPIGSTSWVTPLLESLTSTPR